MGDLKMHPFDLLCKMAPLAVVQSMAMSYMLGEVICIEKSLKSFFLTHYKCFRFFFRLKFDNCQMYMKNLAGDDFQWTVLVLSSNGKARCAKN